MGSCSLGRSCAREGCRAPHVGYMDTPFASPWLGVSVSIGAAVESAHPCGLQCCGVPGIWSKGQLEASHKAKGEKSSPGLRFYTGTRINSKAEEAGLGLSPKTMALQSRQEPG